VAVANALPALKERCDEVAPSPRGAGVVELIDAEDVQRHHPDDPSHSRARLREAIERRYTMPV
jgi:hypothetical protein